MCTSINKFVLYSFRSSQKRLADTSGFAVITALMFTLISLTIVMSMMYLITQSTRVSGANKRYKTAIEASYGGAELFAKDMLPFLMVNFSNTNTLVSLINSTYNNNAVVIGQSSQLADVVCLQAKLMHPSSMWVALGCSASSNSPSPTDHPDLTFNVLSATGNPYTIYSKIVETTVGNSDVSGLQLLGEGVAEGSPTITPMHYPYIYRLEVQGEQSSTSESGNIEVLYAY